jgi:6-phosphogluconate dehydrogenase
VTRQFGVYGLGVMGRNLALNVERNGFSVAVFNRERDSTERFLAGPAAERNIAGAASPEEFVRALERPRRILLMVQAGPPVDQVVEQLRPLLDPGDIIVDGGNSHYRDTERRLAALGPSGIRFVGMGVSGGEEGALRGPSLMPGGERSTYELLEPILARIAAKVDTGPCVTWCGRRSAGHFVKMVHNGIEYGILQLLAEAYDLLRCGLGLEPPRMAEVFAEWNQGELSSFLVEITAKIVNFPDDRGGRGPLLERILDVAGQKGTGKWTTAAALDLGVPVPTITAAVDSRIVSASRAVRLRAARIYPGRAPALRRLRRRAIEDLRHALYASTTCCYAQGFELLRSGSRQLDYGTSLAEVARIWKGGCIVRAALLDRIRAAFQRDPDLPNLLLDPSFGRDIRRRVEPWRRTVSLAVRLGLPAPAMSASLAYFDSLRRRRLPANLIQAQRDYFGAHTYERIGEEGRPVHTDWSRAEAPARRRLPRRRAGH